MGGEHGIKRIENIISSVSSIEGVISRSSSSPYFLTATASPAVICRSEHLLSLAYLIMVVFYCGSY